MKLCSLSSGSKGNSFYVETDNARILIDVGISGLQARKRLESIGVEPDSIDGIILTHSHRDHINGVGVFARQTGAQVYGHPETLDEISSLFIRDEKVIPWSGQFEINGVRITPFRVSHDSYPTVGYLLQANGKTLGFCTDTGIVTNEIVENLSKADLLVLESNHDPDMLINGPYPWHLKERIASRMGHLSNHESGALLKKILNGRMERIFLAHLSDENNTPEIALQTVLDYIGNNREDILTVLEQKTVSPIFNF